MYKYIYEDNVPDARRIRCMSKLTRKAIAWAYAKRKEGHEMTRIADALGCHHATVKKAIVKVYGKLPAVEPLVYEEEA